MKYIKLNMYVGNSLEKNELDILMSSQLADILTKPP